MSGLLPPPHPLHLIQAGAKRPRIQKGNFGRPVGRLRPAARHSLIWSCMPPPGLMLRYLWLPTAGLLLHLVVSLLSRCVQPHLQWCCSHKIVPSRPHWKGPPQPAASLNQGNYHICFPQRGVSLSLSPHPTPHPSLTIPSQRRIQF